MCSGQLSLLSSVGWEISSSLWFMYRTQRMYRKDPQYLMDCCIPISDVVSWRHLRSAKCHQLVVPRHNPSTYGRQAFAADGPAAWNSLGDDLLSPESFRRMLKTRLFSEY